MRRAMFKGVVCAGVCSMLMIGNPFSRAASGQWAEYRAPQCRTVTPVAYRPPTGTVPRGQGNHYDAATQANFVTRIAADGRAVVQVRAGDLLAEKTVGPDGSFTVVLSARDDRLMVSVRLAGVDVTRGGKTLHLELGQSDEDEFLKVKELIAGSRALRLHRLLAANLEAKTHRTPGGIATVLTDAFVGLLDGDVGAIERFGKSIAERKRANVKRVRLEDDGQGCYEKFEAEAVRAWDSYMECRYVWYSQWNPLRELCHARYVLWAESAWFSFLSCSAIPLRAE